MSDPQTSNIGLYQPTRGSDSGTWDLPVNANSGAEDTLFANIASIALSNVNVTLSTPPNTGSAWSGPYQSQSAVLRFSGILTGNVTITLPRSGFFIVENLCTGAFVVRLASATPGKLVCSPPGEAIHVYCDGTDVKYVDMDRIGAYMDLPVTAVPAWITSCSVPPYLNCDGSAFNGTTYPVLAGYLGGTTLPDLRGRSRFALDQGTGRITNAGSGIVGTTLLSSGGAQNYVISLANLPANIPFNDPGHSHFNNVGGTGINTAIGGNYTGTVFNNGAATTTVTTGITINPTGLNTALITMPPTLISGLMLIRAG